MAWLFVLPLITILPAAILFHLLPAMHKETYFAVRIAHGFRESMDGTRILRRYRLTNALLCLIGIMMMLAGLISRIPWAIVAGPLLHSFGMMAAIQKARLQVWPHRNIPPDAPRVATLMAEDPMPLSVLPLLVLPALILGGAAWYLSLHWASLPDSFPVHWGLDGLPNRWVQKSFKGVYGVLLIGASTMLLLYLVLAAILFGARRGAGELRMMRATLGFMLGIMTSVSLLLALIALHPLSSQPNQMGIPMPVALILPLGLMALSMIPMWRARNGFPEDDDRTPDECWRMGNYYFNPDDPAWMVRNRIGFGYSPNFAHPVMKFAFALMVAQLLLTVFYVAT